MSLSRLISTYWLRAFKVLLAVTLAWLVWNGVLSVLYANWQTFAGCVVYGLLAFIPLALIWITQDDDQADLIGGGV